jgi:hypothetical protein
MRNPPESFGPPKRKFLADDTPMLKADPQAELADLRACMQGATLLEPRPCSKGIPRPQPSALGTPKAQRPWRDWQPTRPLEPQRLPQPPQVQYSRSWDQQHGRTSRFVAHPAGCPVNLLRARQPF